MTTIEFKRSGGVIGNAIHLNLDLGSLPEDEVQRLQRLLLESDFFEIPENIAGEITPDEFQYVITVDAGNTSHTVHVSDTTMPETLLPLVEELTMLKATQY